MALLKGVDEESLLLFELAYSSFKFLFSSLETVQLILNAFDLVGIVERVLVKPNVIQPGHGGASWEEIYLIFVLSQSGFGEGRP